MNRHYGSFCSYLKIISKFNKKILEIADKIIKQIGRKIKDY